MGGWMDGCNLYVYVFMLYVYSCMRVCMNICMYKYMYVCVYVCMNVCMNVCMYICMYECSMYVYVLYVCMLYDTIVDPCHTI